MEAASTPIKWVRILVGGLTAFLLSFASIFLVITGYAFKLGFEARGAPDQEKIQAFAERIGGGAMGPLSLAVLTLAAAFIVARKAPARRPLHGVLVGAVAGLIALLLSLPPDLAAVLGFAGTLAAGWLGGFAAARRA